MKFFQEALMTYLSGFKFFSLNINRMFENETFFLQNQCIFKIDEC